MTAPLGMPSPGDVIAGKYRLTEELGRGSMGVVYGATHDVTGKRVAVKVLFPAMAASDVAAERFLREAKAACRIEHPNVVNVYDAGRDGERLFLVMELLRGEPLSAVLERGPQDPERFIEDFMPVLRGVAAAHAVGVVHRDLKPENIFMTAGRIGYDGDPKVLDFGISKLSGTSARSTPITMDGTIMGTPYYMAPEQILSSKSVDERADVYSLGVILYQAITGDLPFNADNLHALFLKIASGKPRPARELRPDIDPELERVLMRALATDPTKRYQTVESLAFALEPFGEGASFSRPQRLVVPPSRASVPGGGGATPSGTPMPFETAPKLELGEKTHGDVALPAAVQAAADALERSEGPRAPGSPPRTRNSEIDIDVDTDRPPETPRSDPPAELEGPPTMISRFHMGDDAVVTPVTTDPEIDTKSTDPVVRKPAESHPSPHDRVSRSETVPVSTVPGAVAVHKRANAEPPEAQAVPDVHRKPTQLLPDRSPRPVQEVDRRERQASSPLGAQPSQPSQPSSAARRVGGSTLPFGTPAPASGPALSPTPAAATATPARPARASSPGPAPSAQPALPRPRAPTPATPKPAAAEPLARAARPVTRGSSPGPASVAAMARPAAGAQKPVNGEPSIVVSASVASPERSAQGVDVADTDSYDVPDHVRDAAPTVLDAAPPMGHLEEVVARALPSLHTDMDLPQADLAAATANTASAAAASADAGAATMLDLTPPVIDDETYFTRRRKPKKRRVPIVLVAFGLLVLALIAGALAFFIASHVLGR